MKQEEFKKIVEKGNAKIIDVSAAEKFAQSHIKGAVNVPLENLEAYMSNLDKNEEYHIVCRLGIRSTQATETLTKAGFKVHNVEGGMNEWDGETVSE